VKKFICSWFGYTPLIGELYSNGELDLELNPQGTLVERIRAGGYGLGGVLTRSGLDTMVEEKWGCRMTLNGQEWLYHTPIRGNVAIVEAYRADMTGNLVFRRAQRNFSPVMCFAADLVIASVIKPIEPVGNLDPDEIMVPGAVVDILVPQKEGNVG
jgi:acetate CoA/acetoacetate CoA-transferase alpha subunit